MAHAQSTTAVGGFYVTPEANLTTTGATIYWYHIKANQTKGYLNYKSSATDYPVQSDVTLGSGDEFQWCFVGDDTNGYKIYNKASQQYMYAADRTNGTAFTMSTTGTAFDIKNNTVGTNSKGGLYSFLIHGSTTAVLNNYSGGNLIRVYNNGNYSTAGGCAYTVSTADVNSIHDTEGNALVSGGYYQISIPHLLNSNADTGYLMPNTTDATKIHPYALDYNNAGTWAWQITASSTGLQLYSISAQKYANYRTYANAANLAFLSTTASTSAENFVALPETSYSVSTDNGYTLETTSGGKSNNYNYVSDNGGSTNDMGYNKANGPKDPNSILQFTRLYKVTVLPVTYSGTALTDGTGIAVNGATTYNTTFYVPTGGVTSFTIGGGTSTIAGYDYSYDGTNYTSSSSTSILGHLQSIDQDITIRLTQAQPNNVYTVTITGGNSGTMVSYGGGKRN